MYFLDSIEQLITVATNINGNTTVNIEQNDVVASATSNDGTRDVALGAQNANEHNEEFNNTVTTVFDSSSSGNMEQNENELPDDEEQNDIVATAANGTTGVTSEAQNATEHNKESSITVTTAYDGNNPGNIEQNRIDPPSNEEPNGIVASGDIGIVDTALEPEIGSPYDEEENVGISAHFDNNNDTNSEVKTEQEQQQAVFEPFGNEIGDLDDLFVAQEEFIIDDDLTIIIGNGVIPMPVKTTCDDLNKRNGDWLSGSLPYNDTVIIQYLFILLYSFFIIFTSNYNLIIS